MTLRKIVLIGPMGAGKTTLGTIIAERTSWTYFDNDQGLQNLNQLSAGELSVLPIPELHKLEREYLAWVMQLPISFISGAAASVIDYPESRELLKDASSVYLRLPLEKLLERAGSTGIGRQALLDNAEQVMTERYIRRDPLYKTVAQLTIELGENPEEDAWEIISRLKL